MKKMYKVWATWQIVEAIILIAVGALTIAFSNNEDLYRWIFIAIGSFVILDGILRILIPFFNKDPGDNTLFIGVLELSFGIVVILHSTEITKLLMHFIGVLFFVVATVATADGVLRIVRKKESLFFPVFEFIASLVFIAVGVIIFIAISNPKLQNVVLIIVGAILIIIAIFIIAFTVKSLVKRKKKAKEGVVPVKEEPPVKKKKAKKEEVIEVKAIPVTKKEEDVEEEVIEFVEDVKEDSSEK